MKTLFIAGRIYGHPGADAILCEGGRILALGKQQEFSADSIVDLAGGTVYPGFTDSHMHLLGLGWSMEVLDLVGTPSQQAILEKVASAAETLPPGTWIEGRGWDQNDWENTEFPHKAALDRVAPHHPVYLRRIDGHAAWVNSLTLQEAGIYRATPDPPGGVIRRDDGGQPTGILIDNALDLVESKRPPTDRTARRRQIRKAAAFLNSLGITALHDAGTEGETIAVLKALIAEDSLTVRVYAMLEDDEATLTTFLPTGPVVGDYLTVRAVKLYLDGAMGSRGAALLEPYADDPGNRGLLFESQASLTTKIQRFNSAGFQVGIHAIGDRANRRALEAFAKAGKRELRNRIEHAQIVHGADVKRFYELGITPVMQATHCTSDMYWVDERLGPDRITEAYPWRSLVQAGSIIPGGSDAPVEKPDPLLGIYAALTRQDTAGWPAGGWQSQERLSLEEAVNMYTVWPAWVAFQEHESGQLLPGYRADFTVLSEPLSHQDPQTLLTTKVLFTIVDGKIVYQRP